ncbi:MAG: hypothetical protein RLZZ244_3080 [Verrucomicrobiota bacterium]
MFECVGGEPCDGRPGEPAREGCFPFHEAVGVIFEGGEEGGEHHRCERGGDRLFLREPEDRDEEGDHDDPPSNAAEGSDHATEGTDQDGWQHGQRNATLARAQAVKSGGGALRIFTAVLILMSKRALGIDHGEARIGLALSDELRMFAHPLETVAATQKPLERIVSLIGERSVDVVVLGLPKNMDGTQGPAAQKVRVFGEALAARVPGVRLVYWDERMTTVAAQRSLHEAGRNAKNSRAVIDQVAAQLILQGWLDSQNLLAP